MLLVIISYFRHKMWFLYQQARSRVTRTFKMSRIRLTIGITNTYDFHITMKDGTECRLGTGKFLQKVKCIRLVNMNIRYTLPSLQVMCKTFVFLQFMKKKICGF